MQQNYCVAYCFKSKRSKVLLKSLFVDQLTSWKGWPLLTGVLVHRITKTALTPAYVSSNCSPKMMTRRWIGVRSWVVNKFQRSPQLALKTNWWCVKSHRLCFLKEHLQTELSREVSCYCLLCNFLKHSFLLQALISSSVQPHGLTLECNKFLMEVSVSSAKSCLHPSW